MPAVNYTACQVASWNRTGDQPYLWTPKGIAAVQAPKNTGVHSSATREFNLYNYVGGMPTSLEGMPRNTVSVNQWANLCCLGACGAYQRRGYIVQPMSYSATLPQEVDRTRQSPSNSDDESDDRDAPDRTPGPRGSAPGQEESVKKETAENAASSAGNETDVKQENAVTSVTADSHAEPHREPSESEYTSSESEGSSEPRIEPAMSSSSSKVLVQEPNPEPEVIPRVPRQHARQRSRNGAGSSPKKNEGTGKGRGKGRSQTSSQLQPNGNVAWPKGNPSAPPAPQAVSLALAVTNMPQQALYEREALNAWYHHWNRYTAMCQFHQPQAWTQQHVWNSTHQSGHYSQQLRARTGSPSGDYFEDGRDWYPNL